jgi:hypothetical protein
MNKGSRFLFHIGFRCSISLSQSLTGIVPENGVHLTDE